MEGLPNYLREERPWGSFERFTLNEPTTVKIVRVKGGEAISLQTHAHRDEFWRIIAGSGVVTIDGTEHPAEPGNEFLTRRGSTHRVAAGEEGLTFLEIALGEFDEADIKRIEDKYGRT